MKKLLTVFFVLYAAFVNSQSNVSINTTGNAPDSSAGLDIDFNNMGLLIPRIALDSTNDTLTIDNPATSLLIYNTETAGTYPNDVTPGYYYWNGTKWVSFRAWTLTGNAGTTAGNHFIGTTDNTDFVIKTNNSERMRIAGSGNVTMSTSTTNPVTIGGTGASSSLELRSTSGVGTSDFIKFTVGNNGGTEAMRISTAGNLGLGVAPSSSSRLYVDAASLTLPFILKGITGGGINGEYMRMNNDGNLALFANASATGSAAGGCRIHGKQHGGGSIGVRMENTHAQGNEFLQCIQDQGKIFEMRLYNSSVSTSGNIEAANVAAIRANDGLTMKLTTNGSYPMIFYTNDTEGMRLTSGRNLGVGTGATVSARIHSISTTEQLRVGYDASNYLSTTVGSAGMVTLDATGSGQGFTFSDSVLFSNKVKISSLSNDDGDDALVYWDASTGELRKATSSQRYKTNIQNLSFNIDSVLNLRPVQYQKIGSTKTDVGLIAEEVEVTMPEMVYYEYKIDTVQTITDTVRIIVDDSVNTEVIELHTKYITQINTNQKIVEGVLYQKLPVYLLAIIKEQQGMIQEDRAIIQNLKTRIEALEAQ